MAYFSALVYYCHPHPPRLDGPMPEGVDVLNGTLHFMRPLQQNDSGVYRCTVENDIDTRSRETRVWIRGEGQPTFSTSLGSMHEWKLVCLPCLLFGRILGAESKCDLS